MEFKNIKKWQVKNGIAKPVNPYNKLCKIDLSDLNLLWYDFKQESKQHTYATSAPNGIHLAEMFGDIYTQYQGDNGNWFRNYPEWPIEPDYEYREFLPFKHPVGPNDKQPENWKEETALRLLREGHSDKYISGYIESMLQVQPLNPNANAIKVCHNYIKGLDKRGYKFPRYKGHVNYAKNEIMNIIKLLEL